MVINDESYDYDFRVESDTNTHALFVDAGNSYVNLNSSATPDASVAGFMFTADQLYTSAGAATTLNYQVRFYNGNGLVGSITTDGSATAYLTSSDQRLKENIADADDAGSKIDAIQVRKFDWKVDGSHQDYGMIAQELQLEIAPEAVSGDADSEEMMGVDYSKLVPMLVKEIQSLRARVAQLRIITVIKGERNMAITNTWSVTNMQHTDADGGVFLVYWSMVAASDGTPSYTASEGGKLRCEYDASSPTYIPYADLTEADVLEWVYTSLIEGDETAAEAKARVEADRDAKVQKQIDAAATTASGVPWTTPTP
jgi:hypothetical protein